MKIEISSFNTGGFKDKKNIEQELITASFEEPWGAGYIINFDENDIKEITGFINAKGLEGHLPFHQWLKKNKKVFFKKHVNDSDSNKIVIKLLEKLQDFFMNYRKQK